MTLQPAAKDSTLVAEVHNTIMHDEFGRVPVMSSSLEEGLFHKPADRELENAGSIGGMRKPAEAVMKSGARHLVVGSAVRKRLETIIASAPTLRN
eukprot:551492-Amphidinium_carterae.1